MRYAVHFIAGSQRLVEQVHANSPREAQNVVQTRNPNAKIINVTVPRSWE